MLGFKKDFWNNFFLYAIIFTMFTWDIFDYFFDNSPFIILLLLLVLYIIIYRKICYNKMFICIATYIFVHGCINILFKNNTILLFIKQFGSIILCYLLYNSVAERVSIIKFFKAYYMIGFWTSVYGICEQFFALIHIRRFFNIPVLFLFTDYNYRTLGMVRIAGICREPSFLGYLYIPIVALIIISLLSPYMIDEDLKKVLKPLKNIIILLCYLMTFSLVAYLGILITLFFVWIKKRNDIKKWSIFIVLFLMSLVCYLAIPDIHMRVKDTFCVFTTGQVSDTTNLSTYTYFDNYQVTKKNMKNSYYIGTGLGSFKLASQKYKLPGWGAEKISLNGDDGNSSFYRIAAELGIIGVLLVVIYLYKYYIIGEKKAVTYMIPLLTVMILILLRQGNYTHGGIIMLVCMYKKNYIEYKQGKEVMNINEPESDSSYFSRLFWNRINKKMH